MTKKENSLADLMTRLSQGSDTIIVNPNGIEKLREKGVPIEIAHNKTLPELFKERLESAIKLEKELPPVPNEFFSQSIRSLYREIQECILFSLNGAAITLSAILIEFTLKRTTYTKEVGGYGEYDPEKWEEFEKMDFGESIGRAKKVGLLGSKPAKELKSFRKNIRNPYIHYNLRSITKGAVVEKAKILNFETQQYEEKDMYADDNPIIQSYAKPFVDKGNVITVFEFADAIVKYLINRLEEKL
ncbi:MAG: hypothetical protein JW885_08935 [Deltaproteobacteria bacterium]|nr:hypothetical protein [Candidatus Zymogenaceae bacterium]